MIDRSIRRHRLLGLIEPLRLYNASCNNALIREAFIIRVALLPPYFIMCGLIIHVPG